VEEFRYSYLEAKPKNKILFTKKIKVKVKLSLCLTNQALHHEGVWESGCIDPHFLDLGTNWKRMVSFTLLPLYPWGEKPPVPIG
jgi:hypothetical protein